MSFQGFLDWLVIWVGVKNNFSVSIKKGTDNLKLPVLDG